MRVVSKQNLNTTHSLTTLMIDQEHINQLMKHPSRDSQGLFSLPLYNHTKQCPFNQIHLKALLFTRSLRSQLNKQQLKQGYQVPYLRFQCFELRDSL